MALRLTRDYNDFFRFSLVLDLHYDGPLYLRLFLLLMTSCTRSQYHRGRRGRDRCCLVDQSQGTDTEDSQVALCHRLLVDKNLRRWGYALLTISMTIRNTTPA